MNALTAITPAEVNTIQTKTNETVAVSTTNAGFLLQIPAFYYSFQRDTVSVSIINLTITLQAVSNMPI